MAKKKATSEKRKKLTKAQIKDLKTTIVVYNMFADLIEIDPANRITLLETVKKTALKEFFEKLPKTSKGLTKSFREEASVLEAYIEMYS